MADQQFSAQIDAEISDESLQRMEQAILRAFEGAQKPVLDRMNALLGQFSKRMAADLQKAIDKQNALADATKRYTRFTTDGDKATVAFTAQIVKLTDAVGTQIAAINKAASENRNASQQIQRDKVSERIKLDRERQIDLQNLRESGKRGAIEAQRAGNLQLVAAREAAQQRVQITRFALETIGRLEKGFVSIATGIVRTTGSILSRSTSAVTSVITRQNREFTSSVSTSLSRRERLIQDSFLKQERVISTSVTRTSQQLERLRREVQTGIVGAAGRSGLFGSLLAGAGALGAIASTFTIGADFTRGLAVLQAQLSLTGDQMAAVRQLSIDLGNDISLPGVSALDAAQAIQLLSKQFASLGPEAVTAASAAAKGALQLARAANVTAEESAQVVGSAVNVFGISADKATEVADQVAAALKNAAGVGFSDFSDAFRQAASVFAQFQLPAVGSAEALTEFNTALAVLAKNGVVGSDAGTSLKQFFLQANRGTAEAVEALNEVAQRAGEVGTAFYDAAGNARPLQETLDILRRGLQGLSDEQRNATLQTIFGSDAVRTANALLGTSTEEYAALTDQVREQGLAAKLAAAQNTGLKGALDAAKSVLETVQILLYEKVNPILGDFVLALTGAVNTILFSDGAWTILRRGLLGVAAGMGAVIATKAAVEVLQLLGRAAALALTPFGALLATAGLIGGVLALMTERSEPLRRALREVGDRFETLGKAISSKAEPVLARVASFVTDTLIPAFDSAADWLGRHLVGAIDTAVSFITGTAVPAILSFGRSLVGVVVPAAQSAARWLNEVFVIVRDKATAALNAVMPYIQPAIDGFAELGSAIATAFSGDFSKLGAGAGRAAGGLVASLSSIAGRIGEILAPYARQVVDFVANAFSGPNLRKIAEGFLDVVEEVGRIIGSIASDPRLIAALGALAGAAAITALRFAKGFAEGVISNLPDLLRPIPGLLADVLFDPDVLIPVLLGAFALTKVLPAFRAIFKQVGEAGASGIADGLRRGPRGGFDFVQTLFGGSEAALRTSSRRLFGNVTDEVTALQNRLRVLGSTTIVQPSKIKDARRELEQLEGAFTPAQKAALQLRDRLSAVGQGFGVLRTTAATSLRGLGTVFSGLNSAFLGAFSMTEGQGALGQIRSGLSQIRTALTNGATELKAIAVSQYGSVGAAIGAALQKGVTTALAGLGGFIAGKAEGAAGGSGAISALATGLAGLAAGGPIVGAAAAGMSLIGASIGRAEERAKRLRQETSSLADAIVKEIGDKATTAVIDLADAFAALDDGGVAKILGPDALQTLTAAGVTFADLQAAAQAANGDFKSFAESLSRAAPALGDLGYDKAAPLLSKLNELFVVLTGSVTEAQTRVAFFGSTAEAQAGSGGGVSKFLGLFDAAPIERFNGVLKSSANDVSALSFRPTALDTLNTALDTAKTRADAAYTALRKLLVPTDTGLQATIDQQILNVAGIGAQIAAAQGQGTTSGDAQARELARQFSDALGQGLQAGIEAGFTDPNALSFITGGILSAALEGVTDPTLRQQITDEWNAAIANAVPQIDEAAAATNAAEYNEKFQEFLDNNPLIAQLQDITIAQSLFDSLNQNTKALGENVAQGLIDGMEAKRANVAAKAASLADTITSRIAGKLVIASPSKVMIEFGRFIGEGLAIGIADTAESVGSAVSKAIDDAIARTGAAADRGRVALAQIGASLFGLATGQDASLTFGAGGGVDVGNALGGITTSQQRFIEQFNSTVEAIFAAARKQLEGKDPLTASERALIGANPFSLGTNSVIGVNNRAAFLDVLDSIAELGDRLLAQGEPLGAVIDQVKTYRDLLVQQASSLGFNTDELLRLVDAIGLSDTALGSLNATVADATAALAAAAAQTQAAAEAESARNQFSARQRIARAEVDYALFQGASGSQIAHILLSNGFVDTELLAEVAGASGDQLRHILFRALGISTSTVLSAFQGNLIASQIGNAASAYFDQNGNPLSLFGPQNLQQFLESVVMPILSPYEPSAAVLDALEGVDSIDGLMDLLEEFLGVDMPDFIDAATEVVDAVDAYIAAINRDIPVYNPTPNTGGMSNTFNLYLPSGDPAANALAVANRLARVSTPSR